MSLYEVFGEDPVSEKAVDNRMSKNGFPSALRLLRSQIQIKKTHLMQQRSVVAPVVDLTTRRMPSRTATFLKVHKAVPLGESPPLSFIPKALKEDKVFLFGEVLIEDEYNPTAPTDYSSHKQKLDERKAKEKIAKDIAERLSREHQEELSKRSSGAAIAPPKVLVDEDKRLEESAFNSEISASEMPPPPFIPSFGGGKGLGVAANIMSRFGYKEGGGLGRSGQGMSTALKVERVGKNSGLIVNEHEMNARAEPNNASPPEAVPVQEGITTITDALKHSSRILMLRNMVGPDEIDDQLEPEVKDEMKKYGHVNKVIIFRLLQASDGEAVRIFVEFTNVGQAIKAFVDLNGRFFGGRSIKASFYDLEAYNANHFDM